ncbi:MAG: adenylate/guanylate cyclase domain-containing protein [Thioalkalispiraceae bacterium]|jgi:class 3 adenylate cyclase/Cdc6-like AAA superfamily ATPase
MYQLEDIAFRYLPRTLIEHWANNPDIRPVWNQWLEGSLMHCDVTGFTAMSEKLGEVGKEGAELMAGVLNQFFERMLAIAVSWGGIQMKFGGDAMLLYFPENGHAQRAAACGLEMQSAMREFSRVRVKDDYHKLQMRIGIHSGNFFVCSVGQVGTKVGQGEGLLHYFIVGKDVNKAADTEPMAEPGQVVVSTETYNLLDKEGSQINKTERENIWLIKKINCKKQRLRFFDDSYLPHHILQRYLMRPISEGLSTGKSEHRRATIIFIYVTGIADLIEKCGDQIALMQIDKYTNLVIDEADKYGGHFAASDASEHGDKLIVLFGAPVAQDEQEVSAMKFALEVKNKLKSLNIDLRHHIGINTGYVFCGEIGSSTRREYTVIGDSVNLSARLMAAADEDEIIISDYTAANARDKFELVSLEPIMVKGKKDPIPICRLTGLNTQAKGELDISESGFVGREKEIENLTKIAEEVVNGVTKQALLLGEAGIGKTRIANEIIERLKENGWLCAYSSCKPYNQKTAYSSFSELLYNLIGLDSQNNNDENAAILINRFREYCFDSVVFMPLIAELLNISIESNPVVRSLDNKIKREKRADTAVKLISSISKQMPVFLFIDNYQWIDSSSKEIIDQLLSDTRHKRVFVTYAARSIDELSGKIDDSTHTLEIERLEYNDAFKLVRNITKNLDEGVIASYVEKTKGNPLFLTELAKAGDDIEGDIPDTIYDVVMAKLDKLPPDPRYLLQIASVIGRNFDRKLLTNIM